MKIIGKAENGKLICIISEDEVCKVFNHSSRSSCTNDQLKRTLDVGCELDLGKGYDFRDQIKQACDSMVAATKTFKQSQDTLFSFATLTSKRLES